MFAYYKLFKNIWPQRMKCWDKQHGDVRDTGNFTWDLVTKPWWEDEGNRKPGCDRSHVVWK